MKAHHSFTALFACILFTACSAPSFPVPEGTILHDLRTGAELSPRKAAKADGFYGTWQEQDQSISFVRYRADAFQTTVVTAEGEKADSTGALCLQNNAVAGINGSYFNMRELIPVTFVKDDGFVVGPASPRSNGALVLNPESFRIEACDTTATYDLDWEVLAAHPLLIDDGEVYTYSEEEVPDWGSFYNRRHPRSLVGQDDQGGVWLVVVDGRFPGEAEGMTIAELTDLALRLGLTDALNLDGGGSSTLWVLPEGVLNHPCDNQRYDHEGQRIVPNAVIVR